MEEIFSILAQSIKTDPISQLFTKVIGCLFLIGCISSFISLACFLHKKTHYLRKIPEKPIIFTVFFIPIVALAIFLSWISWVFSLIFSVVFLIITGPRLKKLRFLSVSPSLLTTIGILGTFVGIYMGLQEFNISDIDTSIPYLLKGLKVAFTTSIVGIIGAILLKIIQSNTPNEQASDIVDIFNNIHETLHSQMKQSKAQHEKILQITEKNITIQNKIQIALSKASSSENSSKSSLENFKTKSDIKETQ